MCGIFCITSGVSNDAPQRVLQGLRSLEYRGYDSWGIAAWHDDALSVEKEVGKIGEATVSLNSSVAIGHTRWATHGGVTRDNAHPHINCERSLAIVHNGIIDNYKTLKSDVLGDEHTFSSQTDSEVVAHLLEELPFIEAFRLLDGLNAVIALDVEKGRIWGAKTGSPLVVGYGKDENYLASDAAALLPLTNIVYFLQDGEAVLLTSEEVEIYDVESGERKTVKPVTLDWKIQDAQLIGYDHYLIKEVNEQPSVIRAILSEGKDDVERLSRLIRRSYGTFFVACGTAANAAMAGEYMFSKIAKRHVNVASGSEFTYLVDFVTRGSLVVALSQSGETIDTIESVKAAKNNGATIASLVNVAESTLYRLGDAKMLLRAGPEKCVLATKSYIAKLALLYLVAHELAGRSEEASANLLQTAEEIREIIKGDRHEQVKRLAKELAEKEDLYLIGRGASYADALEGALKIKEVSYIHAEGFAGGELKHGSIALVEEGTPIIVFAPLDETYPAIISNAMEVKARGATLIGISPQNNEIFNEWIQVANIPNASNLINIVPIQLLAYYLAIERGCDPDKPRNLAKSVTVR